MKHSVLTQITDVIDEFTNLEDDTDKLTEQLLPMLLTAMMVLVIRKNTTEEERQSMINASVDRFRYNIVRDLDCDSLLKLDGHLKKAKQKLCGMLL